MKSFDYQLTFLYPWALLALFLIALIWVFRKKFHHFYLWGVIFAILIIALAQPIVTYSAQKPFLTIFCVDISASLSNIERKSQQVFIESTQQKLQKHKLPWEIVLFGEKVLRQKKIPKKIAPQMNSNMYGALQMALAIARQSNIPSKVILCTDASAQKKHQKLLQSFKRNKTPIYVRSPAKRLREWQLLSFKTPDKFPEAQKIPFFLEYHANFSGHLQLNILANGKPYVSQKISITKSKNTLKIMGPPLKAAPYLFYVQVVGDLRRENNQAHAFSTIIKRPKVLLVSHRSLALKNALELLGLELVQLPSVPAQLPYGLIILDRLFLEEHSWANPYLQKGGSILLLEKANSFPWVPATKILSPPKPPPKIKDHPKKKTKLKEKNMEAEMRTASLVLIIDRSGSMAGEKLQLARQAALQTIARLWLQDMVGVIVFDDETQWIVPLGKGTNIKWVARRLGKIEPRGGTLIKPALEKAYEALQRRFTHIKHVILLSDGRDDSGILGRKPILDLVKEMAEENISVTAIGVGSNFDSQLMPLIAKAGGGGFYTTLDYTEIPIMMLKDVDRILKFRQPPKTQNDIPISPLAPIFPKIFPQTNHKDPAKLVKAYPVKRASKSLLLKPFSNFPPVAKYEKYKPKKNSQLELFAAKDPLLLHWHWGAGKVMLWCAEAKIWEDWSKYPYFWGRLTQFLLPSSFSSIEAHLKIQHQNSLRLLELNATDRMGKPLEKVSLKSQIKFTKINDSHWQAKTFLTQKQLPKKIQVEIWQDGTKKKTVQNTIFPNNAKEFADLEVNEVLLLQIATATGGAKVSSYPLVAHGKTKYNLQEILLWMALFFVFLLAFSGYLKS